MILWGDNSDDYIKLFGDVKVAATISWPTPLPANKTLKFIFAANPSLPLSEMWPHFKMII